ncbi:hypothetical protein F0U62_04815 [Cystobacter fuscus]|uniref:hypothetical protein n=1 Tax=Cystobacter fuscus TaxID=43 RepID=UPI002B2FF9B9|nr:hypothetical protein F0U62_04815 [Cystobacter fuscus]
MKRMGPSSRNFINEISKTDTTCPSHPPPDKEETKQEVGQADKPSEEGEYLKKLTVSSETSPPHQTKAGLFVRGGSKGASKVNSWFQK